MPHSLSHDEARGDTDVERRERVSDRRADRLFRAERFYNGPIPAAVWKWINEGDKTMDEESLYDTATLLTFGEFSQANRARCESLRGFNHKLDDWSTSDWMTALVGEVGEAANVVKKLNRYRDGIPGNKTSQAELRDQLRKELGDVFVYLDLMAQSLGFNIADAATDVFNAKSKDLGYPVKL